MRLFEHEFIAWAHHQHDTVCNQKYDKVMPYSMHLIFVMGQYKRFAYLLSEREAGIVRHAVAGHDLIEDARITYNDIVERAGMEVADVIYACTELRGKNRTERHGSEYIDGLQENRLALFVKLCDIMANVTYSILSGSAMLEKYRKEFPNFQTALRDVVNDPYSDMFDYLESLLNLHVRKHGLSNSSRTEA